MLNGYQKELLRSIGVSEDEIREGEKRPMGNLGSGVFPVSPEAGAEFHHHRGIYGVYGVIMDLEQDDIKKAEEEINNFRQEVLAGERGTAKDSLTRLQGLGVIEELYEGPVVTPNGDLTAIREELWMEYKKSKQKYLELQGDC